jgi:hypothetical protein
LALAALISASKDGGIRGELSPKQTGRLCAVVARLSLEEEDADVSFGAADVSIDEARSGLEKLVDFGAEGFGGFLETVWEKEPALYPLRAWKGGSPDGERFLWPLESIEGLRGLEEVLGGLLERALGCPPPAAEESDVIRSLREASGELGTQLVYGQDVTVVKTVAGRLIHFGERKSVQLVGVKRPLEVSPEEGTVRNAFEFRQEIPISPGHNNGVPKSITAAECRAGFREGFSVAIRGLQYRVPEVALLAEAMALALGQASVGVNAYLTPPNSQGLAAHYDDHCVFVWQLAGFKLWRVYEQLEGERLPPLYAPRTEPDLAGRVCRVYRVGRGDVLYIPRGWTHVATALGEESMHVTFGVEVEEPFRWAAGAPRSNIPLCISLIGVGRGVVAADPFRVFTIVDSEEVRAAFQAGSCLLQSLSCELPLDLHRFQHLSFPSDLIRCRSGRLRAGVHVF